MTIHSRNYLQESMIETTLVGFSDDTNNIRNMIDNDIYIYIYIYERE